MSKMPRLRCFRLDMSLERNEVEYLLVCVLYVAVVVILLRLTCSND